MDILTFANDPVQDGLQLLDADLHVLGKRKSGIYWVPPSHRGFPSYHPHRP